VQPGCIALTRSGEQQNQTIWLGFTQAKGLQTPFALNHKQDNDMMIRLTLAALAAISLSTVAQAQEWKPDLNKPEHIRMIQVLMLELGNDTCKIGLSSDQMTKLRNARVALMPKVGMSDASYNSTIPVWRGKLGQDASQGGMPCPKPEERKKIDELIGSL
jgi:hypothetical protein